MPKFITEAIKTKDTYVIGVEQDGDGVTITLEDKKAPGSPWSLLSITNLGKLKLATGVPKNNGVEIDSRGSIIIDSETF